MPSRRHQIKRILKRDRICGRHIDGCGRTFLSRKEATVGHLIPQSLYDSFDPQRASDFAQDWNVQPECARCNNERGGMLEQWPLFKCKCHYLWIDETGPDTRAIYVAESLQGPTKKHVLHEWRTDNPPPGDTKWLYEHDVSLTFSRMPPRGENLGWSRKPSVGHVMVPIPEVFIPAFNWFEYVRISPSSKPRESVRRHDGQTTSELRCRDHDIVEFMVNDQVEQLLPRKEGFRNISYFGIRLRFPDDIVSIQYISEPLLVPLSGPTS